MSTGWTTGVAALCAAGLLGLLVWFGYGHHPPAPNPAATPSPRATPTASVTRVAAPHPP